MRAIETSLFIHLVSWTMESRICEIGAVHNSEIYEQFVTVKCLIFVISVTDLTMP